MSESILAAVYRPRVAFRVEQLCACTTRNDTQLGCRFLLSEQVDIVQWQNSGLQNRRWGFESLWPRRDFRCHHGTKVTEQIDNSIKQGGRNGTRLRLLSKWKRAVRAERTQISPHQINANSVPVAA